MGTRARPQPRNFAAGELAPWLDGITNEITNSGARTLLNFVVKKNGAAVRRPGTFYAGEVKTSADATIIIPVVIDDDNRYVLEVGDAYIRFWNQSTHAVVGGVGSEYEVTSPWSTGELSDIRWAYTAQDKALYLAHPLHPTQKLAFTSAADWTLGNVDWWINPPWIGAANSSDKIWVFDSFETTPEPTQQQLYPGKSMYPAGADSNGSVYVVLARTNTDSVYQLFISSDGKSWALSNDSVSYTARSSWVPKNHIAHNDQGKFIVVGNTTTITYSDDEGLTWSTLSVSGDEWLAIANAYGSDSWRMLGAASGTLYDRSSADNGYSWTSVTISVNSPYEGVWRSFEYGGGLWFASLNHPADAVTSGYPPGEIYVGSGALTAVFSAGQTINDMAYGVVDGTPTYLALCASNVYASSNGTSWTTVADSGANPSNADILLWTGNRFMALDVVDPMLRYTSDDGGVTWVQQDDTYWGTDFLARLQYWASPVAAYGQPVFGSTSEYPSAIAAHENRLYLASTVEKPSYLWGSKSGEPENVFVGDTAEDALEVRLLGPKNVDIEWIVGGNDLVVGTRTAEGVLRGEPGVGITGQARSFMWQSSFGSKSLQPVRVNDHVIFVQRGGEVIRGFVPGAGTQSWKSPDLTALADHIASGGVNEIDHQEDPWNIVWFPRNDGQLLACTFSGASAAWARQATYTNAGSTTLVESDIESIAVVPTSGNEDEVWMVVERTIGGSTVRYIEYMDTLNVASKEDAHFVDAGVEKTDSVTFSTMGGLTHLANENVDALIDGNLVLNDLTVSASGVLTFTTGYSGTQAHAGLPYDSHIQTMRTEAGSQWGSGAGMNRASNNLLVWVYDTLGGRFGPTQARAEADAIPSELVAGSGTSLVTDIVPVNFDRDSNRDNYIWVVQNDPLPMTIIGLAPDMTTGDS